MTRIEALHVLDLIDEMRPYTPAIMQARLSRLEDGVRSLIRYIDTLEETLYETRKKTS